MSPTVVPLAGLGIVGLAYWEGTAVARRGGARWSARRRSETWLFFAGLAAAVAALAPPLDRRAEDGFAAHMVQHLLLAVVAAPLLALGAPGSRVLRALPRAWQARWSRWRRRHRTWRAAVAHPLTGWAAFLAAWWVWHVPAMYDAALRSTTLHAAEHASLLAAGYLFAAGLIIAIRRRRAYGAAVVSLTTTSLHSGALGALLLFSAAPLSAVYAERRPGSALADQQLAGIWMWVIAGPVFVAVAVAVVAMALRNVDRRPVTFQITGGTADPRPRPEATSHA